MSENLLPDPVLPDIYKQLAQAKTKRYLVGLVPNGPASNQTFAGVSFPVFTEGYDAEGNAFRKEGAVISLTVEQIKKIREAIQNRVVRWSHYATDDPKVEKRGQRRAATIWDVRTRAFTPMAGDEPLVKYVIFKEAPPEFVQAPAPAAAFEAFDKALAEAEKTELEASASPEDAQTRAKHGVLKKAGLKLGDAQL